jgi:hypothetical protein
MIASARIQCPYCGERLSLAVDASVRVQEYIEDCQVCCRPICLAVQVDEHGTPSVSARREDE